MQPLKCARAPTCVSTYFLCSTQRGIPPEQGCASSELPCAGSLVSQLRLLLPGLAGTAVPAVEALSSSPSVSAALLCAFALVAPSLLSAGEALSSAPLSCATFAFRLWALSSRDGR